MPWAQLTSLVIWYPFPTTVVAGWRRLSADFLGAVRAHLVAVEVGSVGVAPAPVLAECVGVLAGHLAPRPSDREMEADGQCAIPGGAGGREADGAAGQ